ncbi:MAG: RlmE family RNA methyltransferase [Mariprofundaceae bacterium]|nr:RlmE family RNA methyltransferase [Mariprofundaceae bacterium]
MAHKSTQWFHRHINDPFVKKAKAEGKRSRAAFKLTQILKKNHVIIKPSMTLIDLGSTPGSWSVELAAALKNQGLLISVDLLPMKAVHGAHFIQQDFTKEEGLKEIDACLDGKKAHMIFSDIAPEKGGNKWVDQVASIALNEEVLEFSRARLKSGGHLLIKCFMGEGFEEFRTQLRQAFTKVKAVKPTASRTSSSEVFLLATELKQ